MYQSIMPISTCHNMRLPILINLHTQLSNSNICMIMALVHTFEEVLDSIGQKKKDLDNDMCIEHLGQKQVT